jgi:hypothetical protein
MKEMKAKALSHSQAGNMAKQIEQDAQSIAVAMASIHGGKWRTLVDHQHQLVLIRPC